MRIRGWTGEGRPRGARRLRDGGQRLVVRAGVTLTVTAAVVAGCATGTADPVPVPLVALVNASSPATDVSGTQFCAGVLVSALQVLTAAHCVADRAADSFDAIVSADNLCRTAVIDGIRVSVQGVQIDSDADAAVLTLVTPVDIAPVVTAPAGPVDGDRVTAWGWGKDSVGGTAPCRVQPKRLTVTPSSRCAGIGTTNATTYVCAVAAGDRNTCEGDSGGPVLNEHGRLVAITASGSGCLRSDPGTYTLVGPVLASAAAG